MVFNRSLIVARRISFAFDTHNPSSFRRYENAGEIIGEAGTLDGKPESIVADYELANKYISTR
jgi:hypothetical protein